MPDARPLRAIVCDFDRWHRQVVTQLLDEAGFEVVAEAEHAVDATNQVRALQATLVVITVDALGLSGFDAVTHLRQGDDPPEVLVVAGDDSGRAAAKAAGAFDLAVKDHPDVLGRQIDEVRELLLTGERRASGDRRSGEDRRQAQDWSKVTTERRSGDERRGGLRREQDVTATARDIVARRSRPPAQ